MRDDKAIIMHLKKLQQPRREICRAVNVKMTPSIIGLLKILTESFQPEGRGFDSRSSRHVGTLGKSFTYSCLCASA